MANSSELISSLPRPRTRRRSRLRPSSGSTVRRRLPFAQVRACAARAEPALRRLVHRSASLCEAAVSFSRAVSIAALSFDFQRLLGVGQRILDVAALGAGDLVAMLFQHLLDAVDHASRAGCALRSPRASPCPRPNAHRRLSPCAPPLPCYRPEDDVIVIFWSLPVAVVLRRHVEDAVSIDVERDFDLRHATRSRRNSGQMEFAKRAVLRSPLDARPAARALQPKSGCPPQSRTSPSCASGSSCCAGSSASPRHPASQSRASAESRRAAAGLSLRRPSTPP